MIVSKITTLSAFAVMAISAQAATISFAIQADQLSTSGGVAAPQSTLVLFIASTTDGIFSPVAPGAPTAAGGLLGGDDIVLFKTNLAAFGVNGVGDIATGGLDVGGATFPGWTAGDPLAILWFPTLTSAATTIPGGTPYGFYTSAVGQDGSQPWITPTPPKTNYALSLLTTNGGQLGPGTVPASAGIASQTVVPEPSSLILATLGLVTLAARRRRAA